MKRGRPIERSDPNEDKQRARASVLTNVFAFFVVVGSIRIVPHILELFRDQPC